MNRRQAEKALKEAFIPALKPFGFQFQKGLSFQRDLRECTQWITLAVYSDRLGRIRFSVGVGIRFPKVQSLLESQAEAGETATIGTPLHLLRPERTYSDWEIESLGDVEKLTPTVLQDIEKWGLPFFQMYSDPDAVKRSLESEDPRDWFTLDPERRIATLVAIECAQGHKDAALSRLDRALLQLQDAPFKKRYPLQILRERVANAA